ncbi:MAG: radical SAM family heme chaperone HemW [Bdellovibrionales bacterium]|nr:radical SAM family heme chaperone HemW [Bdellovibrionales bacterium]
MSTFSLYIHVPFCAKKCPYCDFTTFAVRTVPEEEYCRSLQRELQLYSEDPRFQGRRIRSIFWGGGTPSLLSGDTVSKIHNLAQKLFGYVSPDIEITLESNPIHLVPNSISRLAEAGVNRLSIGAQSLQPRILSLLGRDHCADDIRNAVFYAVGKGIDNINLDLIFSVPDQTPEELGQDLQEFTELPITHISTYNLTIERGTPFYQAVANGVFHKLSEDVERSLYEIILQTLPSRGYAHYEVSNFAKPGHECAHNLQYWSRQDYLGIGVGAHSFHRTSRLRWANSASLKEYHSRLQGSSFPEAWREELSSSEEFSETVMLGLRTRNGLDIRSIEDYFNLNDFTKLNGLLTSLIEARLIRTEDDIVRLTDSGFACADSVISEIVSLQNQDSR